VNGGSGDEDENHDVDDVHGTAARASSGAVPTGAMGTGRCSIVPPSIGPGLRSEGSHRCQDGDVTSAVVLALAVFAACSVEMVEALTIVLAAGVSRGWRSALEGAAAAVVVLTVIVAAVGLPLARLVPIAALRIAVGGLLLVLGLSWLRKAILRASGHKAPHDEDKIYAETLSGLGGPGAVAQRGRRDAQGFVVAFKGVFLEGMEVVLIVITLGSSSHRLPLAAGAAAGAVVVVGAVGAVVAKQLSRVPENSLKMAVGLMLTSFGIFWLGEGLGLHWPLADVAVLWLVALFGAETFGLVTALRRVGRRRPPTGASSPAPPPGSSPSEVVA
jgi:uncharacterized membrane protein